MVKAGRVETFISQAAAAGAEVERAATLDEALDRIGHFIRHQGFSGIAVSPDALRLIHSLGKDFPLPLLGREACPEAKAGLVLADYGIAGTGTLVHLDQDDEEKEAWTLPQVCFALLWSETIYDELEALAPAFCSHLGPENPRPAQISLVTGPSRTADIECELSIGVHGPSRLIVLLLDGEPG
jgi:L-lactate dehydrogenase complex protein LldG